MGICTAKIHHTILFEIVGDEIVEMTDLQTFKPQQLSNLVWAYATSNVCQPSLFKKVGDEIVRTKDLELFTSQELSNIVWAYATCDIHHKDLFKKVEDAIAAMNTTQFSEQSLSNIAWAYAVMTNVCPLLFSDDFMEALANKSHKFTPEELSQLHQWHLWHSKEKSSVGLPEQLREKCHQVFHEAGTSSSKLQNDVISELNLMGLRPVGEFLTPSGYSLDVLVEFNGKTIGIEVDGPSHYIRGLPNGATALKRRQVSTIDKIPLVSVPYWEWNRLGNDQEKEQNYLRSLLDSIQNTASI